MTIDKFKPKAYWLVLEPVLQDKIKNIFIPSQAQQIIYKIIATGSETNLSAGEFVIIGYSPGQEQTLEFNEFDKPLKLTTVHNVIGSWPADANPFGEKENVEEKQALTP